MKPLSKPGNGQVPLVASGEASCLKSGGAGGEGRATTTETGWPNRRAGIWGLPQSFQDRVLSQADPILIPDSHTGGQQSPEVDACGQRARFNRCGETCVDGYGRWGHDFKPRASTVPPSRLETVPSLIQPKVADQGF